MLDISKEKPINLTFATTLIPAGRGGRKCHLSTLLRWIMGGVRGPDGAMVHLEALRLGGKWITTREAIQRFAERLTPRFDEPTPQPTPRTPGRRRRDSEAAAAELAKMGV